MPRLATVMLLHQTAAGRHYDWMIEDPRAPDPEAGLWTARVNWPTEAWAAQGVLILEPLAPHRRMYLDYQGPISGGRGAVSRIDQGFVAPSLWTDDRIVLDVHFDHFQGRVEMSRLPDARWQAAIGPAKPG